MVEVAIHEQMKDPLTVTCSATRQGAKCQRVIDLAVLQEQAASKLSRFDTARLAGIRMRG